MKRWLAALVLACMLALTVVPGGTAEVPAYRGKHGSAKFIGGRTVVVSIFADDRNTSWDFPLSGSVVRQS